MNKYEIQIQLHENNDSTWMSLVDINNVALYVFEQEQEAQKVLEKLQNEHYPKHCRIVAI